jgi:hypothetical protein
MKIFCLAAVTVLSVATLTACTSSSQGSGGQAGSSPVVATPCSSLGAAQALVIVNVPGATLDASHGYDCSGTWAYVNYAHPQPNPNQSTADLNYVGGRWFVADRLLACGNGGQLAAMPASLTEWGCGN